MDKRYWLGRKRALMSARPASSADAWLILRGPAGAAVRAAQDIPFMLPLKGPAGPGELHALELPLPALPRPRRNYRPRPSPDRPAGDGR